MEKDLFTKIIRFLEENGTNYQLLKHPPVFTSKEAAGVRKDLTLHQGAKAMVLKVQNAKIKMQNGEPSISTNYELPTTNCVMCVLPGDRKIDFKKLKSVLGVKELALADPVEVERVVGVKIGAVSPFGNLSGLRMLVDESLLDNEEIVFNAGLHERSVRMKLGDFLSLVKPEVCLFSKAVYENS